ncbi:MAG TPA: chorismate-binding protein, partial [Longimicrobiales bacterium]|nr:chorismate-binding protein [Longimicrobiales bacterium]
MINLTSDELLEIAREGNATAVPLMRSFLFDGDTAVTAYYKLRRPPFGFLLESLVGGEKWARYTFVGTSPKSAWRLDRDGRVSDWSPDGGWTAPRNVADPLAEIDSRLKAVRVAEVPGVPRFTGGALGFLGYDVVRHMETLPDAPPASLDLPDALLVFTDTVLAIDNIYGRAHAVTLVEVEGARDDELRERYDEAVARLDALVSALVDQPGPRPLPLPAAAEDVPFESSYEQHSFEGDVERIRDYVRAGDAFQVVLSQRLSMPATGDPFDLYRSLRSLNPSPYLYFVELDGIALVGSSPEVLVRVEDATVTVRPIAGTRP